MSEFNGTNYATSYAVKAHEIYTGFPIKEYTRFTNSDIERIYKVNKAWLLGRMFKYFFFLMIDDIIRNQVVFKLPTSCSRTWIQMHPISGDDFIRARQNGAFDDIDYLASNFTGYLIYLTYKTRYGVWRKLIYVNKKYKNVITELTNKGVGW